MRATGAVQQELAATTRWVANEQQRADAIAQARDELIATNAALITAQVELESAYAKLQGEVEARPSRLIFLRNLVLALKSPKARFSLTKNLSVAVFRHKFKKRNFLEVSPGYRSQLPIVGLCSRTQSWSARCDTALLVAAAANGGFRSIGHGKGSGESRQSGRDLR